MDKYEKRENIENFIVLTTMFAFIGALALLIVHLVEKAEQPEWTPTSQGESLYGKPMIIASDENLVCRYWNWQHPFTENRITVQECTPKTSQEK